MKKLITTTMLFGLTILLAACTGGGRAGVGVYHHHHGYGPWWGGRDYYRDRIIVVPDKDCPEYRQNSLNLKSPIQNPKYKNGRDP